MPVVKSAAAVLGLEVGLSGTRAAVVSAKQGRLGSAASPPAPIHSRASQSHDPETWVEEMFRMGAEAVRAAASPIEAIGIACLGPTPVLVDGFDRALAPAQLSGLDRRSASWRAAPGAGPDHVLPSLLALTETDPDIASRAECVLDAAGFLVLALTRQRVMDRVTAHYYSWPGHDLPVRTPPIGEPHAVAGFLTEAAGRRLGLPSGLPVTYGTIDCYADLGWAGVSQAGAGGLVLGSTMVIGVISDKACSQPALETTPHIGEGNWIGGATAAAGLAIDWIEQTVLADDEIRDRARQIEPGEIISLPYLAGERTPLNDPHARGIIAGITLETRREHLFRSMVDGVAVTALDHLQLLESCDLGPDRFRVTGGGARNRLWLEATCDALGMPLEIMEGGGPGVGAAWLAFKAIGLDEQADVAETLRPNLTRHATYLGLLQRSRALWEAAGEHVRSSGEPGSS